MCIRTSHDLMRPYPTSTQDAALQGYIGRRQAAALGLDARDGLVVRRIARLDGGDLKPQGRGSLPESGPGEARENSSSEPHDHQAITLRNAALNLFISSGVPMVTRT